MSADRTTSSATPQQEGHTMSENTTNLTAEAEIAALLAEAGQDEVLPDPEDISPADFSLGECLLIAARYEEAREAAPEGYTIVGEGEDDPSQLRVLFFEEEIGGGPMTEAISLGQSGDMVTKEAFTKEFTRELAALVEYVDDAIAEAAYDIEHGLR